MCCSAEPEAGGGGQCEQRAGEAEGGADQPQPGPSQVSREHT